MKLIPLLPYSKFQYTKVDDQDFDDLSKFRWHIQRGYVRRDLRVRDFGPTQMHRYILGTPEDMLTDHKNGDTLDNQRSNLRVVTTLQNSWNTGLNSNNKTGAKGVRWHKKDEKYYAEIMNAGRKIHLGSFDDPMQAALAYDAAAISLRGEYACVNFPQNHGENRVLSSKEKILAFSYTGANF